MTIVDRVVFAVFPTGLGFAAEFVGPGERVLCQADTLDALLLRVVDAVRVHFHPDAQPSLIEWHFKLNPAVAGDQPQPPIYEYACPACGRSYRP